MNDSLLVVAAVGIGITTYVLIHVGRQLYAKRRLPKRMAEHLPEIEHASVELVHAAIHLAECEAHYVDLVGKVPTAYNSALWQTLSVAKLVEERSFAEADAVNAYGRRRFSVASEQRPREGFVPATVPGVGNHSPTEQVFSPVITEADQVSGVIRTSAPPSRGPASISELIRRRG